MIYAPFRAKPFRSPLLAVGLLLGMVLAACFVAQGQAAAATPTWNDIPADEGSILYCYDTASTSCSGASYDGACKQSPPLDPLTSFWVSKAGDNTSSAQAGIQMNPGDTQVSLSFNEVVFYCGLNPFGSSQNYVPIGVSGDSAFNKPPDGSVVNPTLADVDYHFGSTTTSASGVSITSDIGNGSTSPSSYVSIGSNRYAFGQAGGVITLNFPALTKTTDYTITIHMAARADWRNSTASCISGNTAPLDGPTQCAYKSIPIKVHLVVNSGPTGKLTALTCTSATQGTVSATFSYNGGVATAKMSTSDGYSTLPVNGANSYTWSGVTIPASGSTTVTLYVWNPTASAYVPVDSGTLSNAACATGPNCAGQDTSPPVTLPQGNYPDAGGATQGSGAQSGATNTPSQQYYQETPGYWEITAAYDQYDGSPSPPVPPLPSGVVGPRTDITWTNAGYQASSTFTLHYDNYVIQYPYDDHQTYVEYNQQFTETHWYTSGSVDYYTCDGVNNGTSSSCSTQTADAGQTCTTSSTGTKTCTNNPCSSPYSGTGGSDCSYTPTAVAWYNWHSTADGTKTGTKTYYSGAPLLKECYHRTFSAHDPSSSVNITPSVEDPSGASFYANFQTDFGFPAGDPATSLHHQNQAPIRWTASYYYLPPGSAPAPSGTPLPGSTRCSPATSGTVIVKDGYGPAPASANPPGAVITSCSGAVFIPPLSPGSLICASFDFSPTGDYVDENGAIQAGAAGNSGANPAGNGQHMPTYACSAAPLTNRPYAQFFGNDVSSGGAFATGADSCNNGENPRATGTGIYTYTYNFSAWPWRGSGSQFAAMSLSNIQYFASAFLRTAGAPQQPYGLSFANNGTLGNSGIPHCAPDYMNAKPSGAGGGAIATSCVPAPPAIICDPQAYAYSGNVSLGGLSFGNGVSATVYVTGNVEITGNIAYASPNWSISGKTSTAPAFYLIASGNITVDPGVTHLDGVYISQGGNIITCDPGASDPYTVCGSQLVVRGALIAKNINLYRTYSSLRNSAVGEWPSNLQNPSNGNSCASGDNGGASPPPPNRSYDCGAEVLIFDPGIFLTNPAMVPNNGMNSSPYDYITSLSPVL